MERIFRISALARHCFTAWLLISLPLICAAPALGQSQAERVKGAFLLRFPRFIEWPAAAFAAPQPSLNICLVGRNPFGAEFLEESKNGAGRQTAVVRLLPPDGSRAAGCHLVYLPASSALKTAGLGEPTTVVVTDGRQADPGQINFELDAGKQRFRIDSRRLAGAGVKVSSKLLKLGLRP